MGFALEAAGGSSMVRLSKSIDYLLDNHHVVILSGLEQEIKEKVDGLRRRFQIGNLAPPLRKGRGEG